MLHESITYCWIHIFKIQLLDHVLYMFLTCFPIFMPSGSNLPLDLETHLLCVILNYKNFNLNKWLMTWLLNFDHLEILYALKIYEDNVI